MLVRVSPIEKVTSYQRFEGDEGISYVNIWRKCVPDRGTSRCVLEGSQRGWCRVSKGEGTARPQNGRAVAEAGLDSHLNDVEFYSECNGKLL